MIDINTGVLVSGGVDGLNNRYTVHPDTGVPFTGFEILDRNNLKELAKNWPFCSSRFV